MTIPNVSNTFFYVSLFLMTLLLLILVGCYSCTSLFLISLLIKYCSNIPIVAVGASYPTMTWNSCIHSPSINTMLYSMGPSIHMPGECMGRTQSRIGILIRLI